MNRRLQDLLYAPIGLVAGASQMIPELADQGRIQVKNARLMGQMATQMGSAKLTEHVGDVGAQAHALLVRAGLVSPDVAEASAEDVVDVPAARPTGAKVAAPVETDPPDSPAAEDLAIIDYDSLAASQVVPRLVALTSDELEAVRRYELAKRGRKTILGRIAQLQN